ncbi:MAG: hypothetical protein ABIK09_07430 [Pseudomonadota bacterium]
MSGRGRPSHPEDFHHLLFLLEQGGISYLIIGGDAYSLHAEPRYTKNLDIWLDPTAANTKRANQALAEFCSPNALDHTAKNEILQIGIAPNRIDLLLDVPGVDFNETWADRVRAPYGDLEVNWMGLDSLVKSKASTGRRRDDADVATLEKIRQRRPGGPLP